MAVQYWVVFRHCGMINIWLKITIDNITAVADYKNPLPSNQIINKLWLFFPFKIYQKITGQ
jgi:hypothetical protein